MIDIQDLWDKDKLSDRMKERMASYARVLEKDDASDNSVLGTPDGMHNESMPMVENGANILQYGTGG